MDDFLELREGEGPVIAAALHAGHEVRPELVRHLALSRASRLREEDPFTDRWTRIARTRIVVRRSRFEVDCNRPRDLAVYAGPEEAWGLDPWKEPLPERVRSVSLELWDSFYERVEELLEGKSREGPFVVYDLHSYNHRRPGPGEPAEPAEANPEVNLGTGSLPGRWRPVAQAFQAALERHDFLGRTLDVRENVRFRGGHFPDWIHERFRDAGCALAVEVKKFFMDEWTGVARRPLLEALESALAATVGPVEEALEAIR